MVTSWVLVVSFLIILTSTPTWGYGEPKSFHIKSDGAAFSISIKGVELLRHTAAYPIVLAGNVQTTFREHHGNWFIDEHLESKIGLPRFQIFSEPRVTRIKLWAPEGPSVELELESHDFNPLIVTWKEVPRGYDRLWLRVHAQEDEHVYGAGEQYSRFDLRGYNYPIWTREQGVGRNKSYPVTFLTDTAGNAGGDYHTSYFPLPTFVSSRRYYCHVGGSNYVDLDFRHAKYHEISIHGPPEAVYFNVDADFETLIRSMTYFLWRQPRLPDWVHTGAILGVQGGTKKMLEHYNEAKDAGVKVSGLWIQDWPGNIYTQFGKRVYWDWVWNQEHYPGLVDEIRKLKEEGVRVLTYITPNLHSKGSLFKVAEEKGYLVNGKDGKTYLQDFMEFYCGTVDLTNPAAFEWYKGIIKTNLIELGFGGWMADFSEYTPVEVVFHNGVDARHMHNHFPVLWAKLNREAVEEAEKLGEVMFFMRAGGTGSQKYTTMTWAGDQNVDWSLSDGLPTVLPAALSLGLSGVGLTHFDIGLYTTLVFGQERHPVSASLNMTRSEELLLRSAELATFTTLMRTHEGNQPTRNWQLNSSPETLQRFAALTRTYRHLADYRKVTEKQQYRGGLPMQRPLFLHYQDDAETFNIGYQYLFGRDLLVAPVIEPAVTSKRVYLPSDTWEHIYTGQVYPGPGWVTVEAPIGQPPVFFRANTTWRDSFLGVKDVSRLDFKEEEEEEPKTEEHGEL